MKTTLDGKEVCSVCWSDWEDYYGHYGDEDLQCASCGASPYDEDLPSASDDAFSQDEPEQPRKSGKGHKPAVDHPWYKPFPLSKKSISMDGYVYHRLPSGDGYVAEHRLVAEKKLGRGLGKDDIVHHINGFRGDNRPENLAVVSRAEHARLHREN